MIRLFEVLNSRYLRPRALLLVAFVLIAADCPAEPDDPVASWSRGVRIAPVSAVAGRHTIHSYYVTNPESPDGRQVLFFASTHPAGYVGQIVVQDRQTGQETVLAENVHTEDAHRAACQQWLAGGRCVAYHEVLDRRWRVVVIDVETKRKTVVAEDRQVGFGQPAGNLLPLYGCHWNPGPHRDLEIWDAATGEIRKPVGMADAQAKYSDWLAREFQGRPMSIFFPLLSPDLNRVFFKIAAGKGDDNYMAKNASYRQGLVCYDLRNSQFLRLQGNWGHPSWHPDSRRIFNVGHLFIDADTGHSTRIPNLPNLRGSHPSLSPDGRLLVTDGMTESVGGQAKEWGILVGDVRGEKWVLVDRFDQSRGARSWRRNDPHPVFSADGRRIYYNVSDGEFTRLLVAVRQ